ncbi:cysteine-rich receptor-like protein kinase, partial [Tanacetum coccineum]
MNTALQVAGNPRQRRFFESPDLKEYIIDGAGDASFPAGEGLDKVLERGPWIIRNSPIILNRWTPNVSLKKNKLLLVGNPIMLDAYTSSMCEDPWGRINFARVLVEINADYVLKHEVSMAIPLEDGSGHTREVIKVEYEWKPPHCVDCKIFGHTNEKCPKRAINLDTPSESGKGPIVPSTASTNCDGFTEVRRKKNKGKKADQQTWSRKIDGVNKVNTLSTSNSFDAFNNMEEGVSSSRKSQEVDHETGPKTSQWNEDHESDTEVDEFIFPEGDKFGDQFDIRLKVGEDDDVSVSNSVECLGGAMVDNFVDVAVSSSNNIECDSNVVHYDNSS